MYKHPKDGRNKSMTFENVKASHILVESEEQCTDLKTMIDSGEISFTEAAKQFSKCPSNAKGGDLGFFGRKQMVKEFEDVCFDEETKVGDVVAPVQTQFGYHLIQLVDRV